MDTNVPLSHRPWWEPTDGSDFIRWRRWMQNWMTRNASPDEEPIILGRLRHTRQMLLYLACCEIADASYMPPRNSDPIITTESPLSEEGHGS